MRELTEQEAISLKNYMDERYKRANQAVEFLTNHGKDSEMQVLINLQWQRDFWQQAYMYGLPTKGEIR